jgi:hypothetical protein
MAISFTDEQLRVMSKDVLAVPAQLAQQQETLIKVQAQKTDFLKKDSANQVYYNNFKGIIHRYYKELTNLNGTVYTEYNDTYLEDAAQLKPGNIHYPTGWVNFSPKSVSENLGMTPTFTANNEQTKLDNVNVWIDRMVNGFNGGSGSFTYSQFIYSGGSTMTVMSGTGMIFTPGEYVASYDGSNMGFFAKVNMVVGDTLFFDTSTIRISGNVTLTDPVRTYSHAYSNAERESASKTDPVFFNLLADRIEEEMMFVPYYPRQQFLELVSNDATGAEKTEIDATKTSLGYPTNCVSSGTLTIGTTYLVVDFKTGDDFKNVGGYNVNGASFVATGTTPTTWTNGTVLLPKKTSGPLTIGVMYTIVNYTIGDDFTNVGAASNNVGVTFIAMGTTPTTWVSSSLQLINSNPTNSVCNYFVTWFAAPLSGVGTARYSDTLLNWWLVTRPGQIAARASQIVGTRLGTVNQNLTNGTFTGTGNYYQLFKWIDFRVGKSAGTRFNYYNLDKAIAFIVSQITQLQAKINEYNNQMLVVKLTSDALGTNTVKVTASKGFNVGNSIKIVDDNTSIPSSDMTIDSVTGQDITLHQAVTGYTIAKVARLVKVL